jgi:hypothetical protein
VLAVFTDGANLKKIGANFKNRGKFRGFLRISSRLADSVPPWGAFVFCQVLAAAVMG